MKSLKCKLCGLPKDLCSCKLLKRNGIKIRTEGRNYGKCVTIIGGIQEDKDTLEDIASKCKQFCACGGTVKNNEIMLQGQHKEKAKAILIDMGYSETHIDII